MGDALQQPLKLSPPKYRALDVAKGPEVAVEGAVLAEGVDSASP